MPGTLPMDVYCETTGSSLRVGPYNLADCWPASTVADFRLASEKITLSFRLELPEETTGQSRARLRDQGITGGRSGEKLTVTDSILDWRFGPLTTEAKRGSGDPPGLQNRRLAPCGVNGWCVRLAHASAHSFRPTWSQPTGTALTLGFVFCCTFGRAPAIVTRYGQTNFPPGCSSERRSGCTAAPLDGRTAGPGNDIAAEIAKQHSQSVKRLQDWIHQPSIAAENRGMTEGCEMMMNLLRDAGFTSVTKVPTDGQPDSRPSTPERREPSGSISCTT